MTQPADTGAEARVGQPQPGAPSTPAAPLELSLFELPTFADARGSLSAIEGQIDIPFLIRRVFYIFDVPEGATRASHSVGTVDEVLIALSGSFDVLTVDGAQRREFSLERPSQGLLIPGHIWRKLTAFSPGAVCMVLASKRYADSDYRPFSVDPAG